MSNFQVPVKLYMTSPVVTVTPDDPLETAHDRMVARGVSSLAVVEGRTPVGVISRSDLLRVGKREAGSGQKSSVLTLPARTVAEEMTRKVLAVSPDTPLATAARMMVKGYIHRVLVTDGDVLVGVLSTRDLMRALEEKQSSHKVGEFMSSPVFTIRDEEPLSEAVERLEKAHVSGLVVVEDGWPVGVFGKAEALDARDLPRSVAVGDVMNPRVLVLPSTTTLHRAAAQAAALGVRRVVIQDVGGLKGILSGLDFARAVS